MLALVIAGEAIFALPFVLIRVFRPTVLEVFEIDNTQLGVAFSFYGTVAMGSYLFGGPLADRFPARNLMATALLTTAAGGLFFYTMPSLRMLEWLYGYFGLTTILLFWAAMLRATREWGGEDAQGRAYGLLDGGRGLVGALISTVSVGLFAWMLPDAANATLEAKRAALQSAILYFTLGTALAAGVVWWLIPHRETPPAAVDEPRFNLRQVGRVLRMPTLWLQAVIVICAYVGYKGTDDFSLLASDALGYDDVQAASVGTAVLWVRPLAAVGAGVLADRLVGSQVILVSFVALIGGNLLIAAFAGAGLTVLLLVTIFASTAFVYGLRGVYFAVFNEARVPVAVTGTAVGVVSLTGYTPDVFFGPLMGVLLDSNPGVQGHQNLFYVLALFSLVGALTTLVFRWASRRAA